MQARNRMIFCWHDRLQSDSDLLLPMLCGCVGGGIHGGMHVDAVLLDTLYELFEFLKRPPARSSRLLAICEEACALGSAPEASAAMGICIGVCLPTCEPGFGTYSGIYLIAEVRRLPYVYCNNGARITCRRSVLCHCTSWHR